MGKPYSLDLRERICAYVAKGNSARSAGRLFGVSAATAVRFAAEHRDHGAALPKLQGRPRGIAFGFDGVSRSPCSGARDGFWMEDSSSGARRQHGHLP